MPYISEMGPWPARSGRRRHVHAIHDMRTDGLDVLAAVNRILDDPEPPTRPRDDEDGVRTVHPKPEYL